MRQLHHLLPHQRIALRDKPKFHVTADSFAAAALGYHFSGENLLVFKHDDRTAALEITGEGYLYENEEVRVTLGEDYAAMNVEIKGDGKAAVDLRHAAEMAILAKMVRGVVPVVLGGKG